MVTRNVQSIGAIIAFCLLAIAAVYWGYSIKARQEGGASVVVEQLKEPAWAVQIQQVTPDQNAPPDESEKTVVASAD